MTAGLGALTRVVLVGPVLRLDPPARMGITLPSALRLRVQKNARASATAAYGTALATDTHTRYGNCTLVLVLSRAWLFVLVLSFVSGSNAGLTVDT